MTDASLHAGTSHTPDTHSAAVDEGGDVAVVRWPGEAARRDDLVLRGRARVLVVADGELPPLAADGLEDWVRADVDPVELYVRKERLRRRQEARVPAVLDGDGVLHRGRWWVALSARDVQVATVLLARPGTLVARADLLEALSPGTPHDEHRLVDTVVRRFHRRVAPLGLRIHTVRSVGFLLELGELAA